MRLFKYLSLMIVVTMLLVAVSPVTVSAQDPPKTIVETAAENEQFETLVAAVQAAGLVDTLNGPGPFTVFAPTDAAFEKLPEGTVEALLNDPEKLKSILLYHVVPSRLAAADVVAASSAITAAQLPVTFTTCDEDAYINNARITTADIAASNGVIHVIDTVLLPPEKDIVDTASANPRFETLVAAVQAAGLAETLQGAGPFTIFAPTDEAFERLPEGELEALLEDPEKLKSILLYHALPAAAYAGDVAKSASAVTVNGAEVAFTVKNDRARVNNARITTPNILATNGVIHAIDRVLLPPDKDIVDTAAADPQFETLVAAVQAAGLVETLKGPGPYTIFAPTDEAFEKLPEGTVEALMNDPEKLKSILLYHALSGKVYSGAIDTTAPAATLNGAEVTFTEEDGKLYVNDARITKANIQTTNGVIHVIDTVILPPE